MQQVVVPNDPEVVDLGGRGRALFEKIGCARCHVPILELENSMVELSRSTKGEKLIIDLAGDAAAPRIARSITEPKGSYPVFLLSDLKRHDLGDELAESRDDRCVSRRLFLTRPLVGLARSAPYLHDGRAPTIEDAIFAHGGEGADSRKRYRVLSAKERAAVRTFLTSLSRARRLVAR